MNGGVNDAFFGSAGCGNLSSAGNLICNTFENLMISLHFAIYHVWNIATVISINHNVKS